LWPIEDKLGLAGSVREEISGERRLGRKKNQNQGKGAAAVFNREKEASAEGRLVLSAAERGKWMAASTGNKGTPVRLPVLGAKNPNGRVAARNEEMLCAGSAGRG
jgi:hypothetical protein